MTTYPLPPAPAWATRSELESHGRSHDVTVGTFRQVAFKPDDDGETTVTVMRWDEASDDALTAGETHVAVNDIEMTPASARELAALLLRAADLAESE